MSGWTKERLDERARKDAERGVYDLPWGWLPGREPAGTRDRDPYDERFKYYSERIKAQSGR